MSKIILVDKNDRKIGVAEKLRVHQEGKLHRAFSIFIFNSKGEMLIQKRAKNKYHSGGLWTNACCSHPGPGKNLKQEAEKRLKEEMGINAKLDEVFSFTYKANFGDLTEYEIDRVFFGNFDASPKINKEEAEGWKWLKPDDLKKDVKTNPEKYSFWFKKILDKVIELKEFDRREKSLDPLEKKSWATKILPSLTTTKGSDWKNKLREINQFHLKEIALFPTCLDKKERQKLYKLLENSSLKSIPLVHIKNDMAPDELNYFLKRFQTKAFNSHSQSEFPHLYQYPLKQRKMIFLENVYNPLDEKEIKNFGGICLDISHLENDRLLEPKKFKHNVKLIRKYRVGCNHLSCLKKVLQRDESGYLRYTSHSLKKLSQLDYLKKYPKNYFSSIIALELENTIKKQLEVRKYLIDKIL